MQAILLFLTRLLFVQLAQVVEDFFLQVLHLCVEFLHLFRIDDLDGAFELAYFAKS